MICNLKIDVSSSNLWSVFQFLYQKINGSDEKQNSKRNLYQIQIPNRQENQTNSQNRHYFVSSLFSKSPSNSSNKTKGNTMAYYVAKTSLIEQQKKFPKSKQKQIQK